MVLIVADRQTFYSYDKNGIEQVGGFQMDLSWTKQHAFHCTLNGRWFEVDSVDEMAAYIKALGHRVRFESGAEVERMMQVRDMVAAAR